MNPQWNDRYKFEDIALSTSLLVGVYDRKKLGHDVLMGHATLPLARFQVKPPPLFFFPVGPRRLPGFNFPQKAKESPDPPDAPVN